MSDLRVSLDLLADRASLESEWRALERCSRGGFFLSWGWIGALLATLPTALKPEVLRVRRDRSLIGLALLWRRTQRRHGLVRTRTLSLNETGDRYFDTITFEHNGLLAAEGEELNVVTAVLRHLASLGNWDELMLPGVDARASGDWRRIAAALGLSHRVRWEKPYFLVDLERVRTRGGDYLDALSPNTRYQARRALRLCADRGAPRCEHAEGSLQAVAWLRELARLHQLQWNGRGQPGAFGTEFAMRFHEQLVEASAPSGSVQLLRISAGDAVIGYVYNFVHDGVVSNYQSGHVEDSNAKRKPGLVCHCLAVEDALRRGHRAYDLLMGGEHFKSSLTNDGGRMAWAVVQQPRLLFRVEDGLRAVRDRLRSSRATRHG